MGGRQAHGRPLIAAPKARASNKKSKARSQKNALDAFGIAQENFAPRQKRTPRARELDAEVERKHGRDEEDEDEDEEEEEPQRKKIKRPSRPANDDADDGSDSEGNEWRLGGLREDDEDSEIESDDAFGDSDEDKFEGYTFRGSKTTQREDDDSEDDSQDDEGQTLGADAIDLATALDQFEESDDEPEQKGHSGSSESDDDASDESEEDDDDDDDDEDSDDDEEASPDKLEALQGLIKGYGGQKNDEDDKPKSKAKISLADLGMTGINDVNVTKSMKLMSKEEKEKRPGASKKLDVPLARRQQDQLDRSAAYEKTNETLDRWNDTVKHYRRAEHLMFPLPQNSATAGLDTTEIQPLNVSKPSNELESAIMSIMEQSGLTMEKPQKPKEKDYDEEGNELTRKEALARKRMERELNSREAKRAKRIKKIKSKAYHRVHRKQRERDEMAAKEAMEEAGEIDSEAEREAQDRRRALERVGQRHKESKWAKIGSKSKRAVWDDDFRAGLTEMARKDEELRRRKEGRAGGSDESSESDSDSDGGDASLRRQLAALEEEEDAPQKGLMGMKFMQKAEAAKKEANDALIKQIRRELDGEEFDGSADELEEIGRRQYGAADGKPFKPALETSTRVPKKRSPEDDDDDDVVITTNGAGSNPAVPNITSLSEPAASATTGAWSRGETRRKKKGQSTTIGDLDLTSNVLVASKPSKSKSKSKTQTAEDTSDVDSDTDLHLPMAIRDQEMVARAFAGEDVVGEFEAEKTAIAEDEDDKVIDNTLPGWGSWVGDGVSAKEKKRHQGRFLTKVDGIKKKDRKDAKLDKVIINEKRIKKNDRYLASQLPHPFESRQQYERSLRLPVGPEWQTKETFQDSTKPRVLMKQGIIAPMSKPTI
ncbi:antigen LSA-1 [Fusarium beomiforme]|uniref:Antigen LSA-1 n=1 Tax=Fusarium beomiforme TaxID=44412 RepID=A0A9P5E777_9HYPO|nr:antigen LSA-1 [Fusarium beomiforme]